MSAPSPSQTHIGNTAFIVANEHSVDTVTSLPGKPIAMTDVRRLKVDGKERTVAVAEAITEGGRLSDAGLDALPLLLIRPSHPLLLQHHQRDYHSASPKDCSTL